MDTTHRIVGIVVLIVGALGTTVVIWGVLEAFASFLFFKATRRKEIIRSNEVARHRLGSYLLLGLEIFIAADIISSIASPSWEKVGMLAVIVVIRTILSYFLGMEFRQSQAHNQAHGQQAHHG